MPTKNPEIKRAHWRNWYRRHRQAELIKRRRRFEIIQLLIRLLKSRPCADCGGSFHFSAMDFDHPPGTEKKFNVANAKGYSRMAILREAARCAIVCANCHRIRTYHRHTRGLPVSRSGFDPEVT